MPCSVSNGTLTRGNVWTGSQSPLDLGEGALDLVAGADRVVDYALNLVLR